MTKTKMVILFTLVFLLGVFLGFLANYLLNLPKSDLKNPISYLKPKPLEKYTIENLSKKTAASEKIILDKTLSQEKNFTSYLFSMNFDPTLEGKNKKKVTGVINIPEGKDTYPIVLMLRGYVDQKIYEPGVGTKRGADYFAQNGFITIAPDFLGYGESDKESDNIFESRFQTYTTTLTLLSSFSSIEKWDGKNIFIWGHSNGGQIALTILEITGKNYPTSLWAPVSKPFPYSILYYTDESEDLGKFIRKNLASFEEDYDVNLFSIHSYLDRIKAPLIIHQGTLDDAVPFPWTQSLVNTLKKTNEEIKFYLYIGSNHNLKPAWNSVILRDLNFFTSKLN